jgi:succinyl-CoA synthetase beta subunit
MGHVNGYAVKAQVLTGGRGLGYFKENNFKGGVHVVSTEQEVRNLVPKMIGKTLVTKQTGEKGMTCNTLFIVEKVGKNNFLNQMLLMKNIFRLH